MNTPITTANVLRGSVALALISLASWSAQAQTTPNCGPDIKEAIAKRLAPTRSRPEEEQLKVQAELYEEYKHCAGDDGVKAAAVSPSFLEAARQCGAKVSYAGSLYYEEMPCCGYDPQRRTFACPVKIKQTFGFGAGPTPGSREYVLNCVADAAGVFYPVGFDSVHLSNALAGNLPTWQFAVVANAIHNLQNVQPMNRATRNARSILSWNFQPTSCSYLPIWGNVIDYAIRLDQ